MSGGQEPRSHPGSAKQVPAFSLEGDVAPATEGDEGGLLAGRYLHKIKRDLMGPFLFCGDGRTRTAVQTTHQPAFYTLILPLIVGDALPGGRPCEAYPLNLGGL